MKKLVMMFVLLNCIVAVPCYAKSELDCALLYKDCMYSNARSNTRLRGAPACMRDLKKCRLDDVSESPNEKFVEFVECVETCKKEQDRPTCPEPEDHEDHEGIWPIDLPDPDDYPTEFCNCNCSRCVLCC